MEQGYDEEIKCPVCRTKALVTARVDDSWRTLRPHTGGLGRWCWAAGRTVSEARDMATMKAEPGFALRAHP